MFDSIVKLFKKIGKKEPQELSSKDAAKERLHLVLMQDRANVSADFLEMMKQEIIEVIKKYIDVDENEIEVKLTNKTNDDGTTGAPALYANIPIAGIKQDVKNETKQENIETKKDINEENTKNEDKDNKIEENKEENAEDNDTKNEDKKMNSSEKDDSAELENTKNKEEETSSKKENLNEDEDNKIEEGSEELKEENNHENEENSNKNEEIEEEGSNKKEKETTED